MSSITCTSCGERVPNVELCVECGADPRAAQIPCSECSGAGTVRYLANGRADVEEESPSPCPARCWRGMIEAPYAAREVL